MDKDNLNNLQYRNPKRLNCHCKVCDRVVPMSEKIIYFRSWRGHGDATQICMNCLKIINELIRKERSTY